MGSNPSILTQQQTLHHQQANQSILQSPITQEQQQVNMQMRLEQAVARRETDACLQAAGRVWQSETSFQQRQSSITVLSIPVPPMFEDVAGYPNEAHYVAMHWGAGEECYLDDGRETFTGESDGLTHFLHHWSVAPILQRYNLRSNGDRVEYWLVLDRWQRQFAVASVTEVKHMLLYQWSTPEQEHVLVVSCDEWTMLVQELEKRLSHIHLDMFAWEMQHQAQVIEMIVWLDEHGSTTSERREDGQR